MICSKEFGAKPWGNIIALITRTYVRILILLRITLILILIQGPGHGPCISISISKLALSAPYL
jgi:hypothetical protein